MSEERKLVFVYGTLKRGGENHHYLANQKFVGEARTAAGFRLYNLGGYPGMVAHAADRDGVFGEVWSVDAKAMKKMDELEGLSEGLYRREPVPLMPPFADRKIDAYIYARSVEGHRESGSIWKI